MMYEGWQVRREYEFEHTRFTAWTINATSWNPRKDWKKPADVIRLDEIDPAPKRTTAESLEDFRQKMSKQMGREIHFVKTAHA